MIRMTSEKPTAVFISVLKTPFGDALAGWIDGPTLCRLSFADAESLAAIEARWQRAWPETRFTRAPAPAPFPALGQAILAVGTPFQQKIWRALLNIPAGKTETYGSLAVKAGAPNAARAVGNALGANPVPFFIPCHRVLAAHGKLGGFSGGLALKRQLLAAEGLSF
jgi:AraC family transcriptional regulator of adaptative response/methylated-DNA-[protein]-cysteine methyltransferase